MAVTRNFEAEKESAVNMFREIINTPNIFEIDFHFYGSVHEPMRIEYNIQRAVLPEYKDCADGN